MHSTKCQIVVWFLRYDNNSVIGSHCGRPLGPNSWICIAAARRLSNLRGI